MVKRRGRTPTPPGLRLVEGTHRADRHGPVGTTRDAIQQSLSSFGDLVMPSHFQGEAETAWRRYIAPCWWLDASREVTAIVFCELVQRLRQDPAAFPAAMHVQLRAYMSELGLTEERNRFGIGRDKTGDEFFD